MVAEYPKRHRLLAIASIVFFVGYLFYSRYGTRKNVCIVVALLALYHTY